MAGIWGLLFGLLGAMALLMWVLYISAVPKPHVHVPTNLQVVEPSATYPLATCVVSGEPLRAIPDRVALLYEGTEVQFCCEHCIADFEKEPAKYMALLRAARK